MASAEWSLSRIADSLDVIAENTKQESINDLALKQIMDLKQTIRNFGMELQTTLDNPPSNGMEMARRMRELASRMTSFGVPEMFQGKKG